MAKRKQRPLLASCYAQIRARPRLMLSILVGFAAWYFAPADHAITRLLVGWNIGTWLFIALILQMMAGAGVHDIRRRSGIEEEGQVAVLTLTSAAAIATLIAIGVEMFSAKQMQGFDRYLRFALAFATIFGSWLLVHFVFALYYAHEYHAKRKASARGARGGLVFPGESASDYWDFLYFSLVVGTTAQTSDVQVTSRPTRRAVMIHGLLSFIFNTAVIALTVNIAAQFL